MDIYVDENMNLIFFSWMANPEYDRKKELQKELAWMEERKKILKEKEYSRPPMTPPDRIPSGFWLQNPIVLEYPYTVEEVIEAYNRTLQTVNQGIPFFTAKKDWFKDAMLFYTGKKKFREATFGKRMLSAYWKSDVLSPQVSLMLPCKRSGMWLGIDSKEFSDTDTIDDFAAAIIHFAQMDLTNHSSVKVFKSQLNL